MIAIGILVAAAFTFWLLGHEPAVPVSTEFDKQWPPISDEEFLERCPEGSSRDVALKVRKIVSDTLFIPYDQVYPEQRFVEDLKAD